MPPPATTKRFPLVAWVERRPRSQLLAVGVVLALYALFRGASSLAGVLLDRWWLDSVTDVPVWSTITWARLQLGVVAATTTALVLGGSLALVRRRGDLPAAEVGGLVRRYRDRMGPAHHWILVAFVIVLTVRAAAAANGHWQEWLLFRHGGDVGRRVPELGGDLGYYLFKLPILTVASTWIRQLIVVTFVVTAFASLISGGLRVPGRGRHSQPAALAQLGLIGAMFAAVQALDYVFVGRPALSVNRSGGFVGPGFTELHVDAPAAWILAIVAIVAGFLLVVGARTDNWRLPVIVLGVWAAAHVLAVVVVPVVVERYVVEPAEADRQLPSLAHNLDATQEAFGLDEIIESERMLADGAPAGFDAGGNESLSRIPLFDITKLPASLQVLQGRTATRITDVDLDRYDIDGTMRPIMVGARSASRNDLPESGWVQEHLVYTHGDGVVAVPADEPDDDGRPDVDALAETLVPDRSDLYFGEGLGGWYAIVGTKRLEQGGSSFAAETGIDIASPFRRGVLALSTGEIEPLLSAELTSESQLLYRRDIGERLRALAPFASFGTDPYPVITAEGIVWVVDGYTTSSTFPYAQYVGFGSDEANYVHASLKATVDAYDGTVHLYRTDVGGANDPILDAWEEIFPDLFEPIGEMPAALRSHLLYPPQLLAAQTALIGRYHVDDAESLFNGTQRWAPAAAAAATVGAPPSGAAQPVDMFLPGGNQELAGAWVSVLPFSPGAGAATSSARDQLAAMFIADNDDGERFGLVTVDPVPGRDVSTPIVAQSAIDADPAIAQLITLLNANGSRVEFGPMTPLLLDEGLVWVRSILVAGTGATAVARLYGVVAVSNGLVGLGDDVPSAIAAAVAQST